MHVIPLGAGQDVGRSCIVVGIGDKTVMFDCGMHMGYNDARKFPDFSYFGDVGNLSSIVDCVIISHFHLDHCGALPYLTEVLGYDGPIFMTHPTKDILPLVLDSYSKILAFKQRDKVTFKDTDIAECIEKIIPLNIHQSYDLDGLKITPYYAGHVLGAAMFHVEYKGESVVYTGDYSTTPDRHLNTAWINTLRPNLLITESTYGSVIRDCRKSKEREFVQSVHECINQGGKVLIPIFAIGRAQELCLLIDSYWDRMGLQVPIYFAGGLTEKANEIFFKYVNYTNDSIKKKVYEKNVFKFERIHPLSKNQKIDGPAVIFASPAMLHSGLSLKIFADICEDEKNTVILPGYCVRGTIGEKVLNGADTVDLFGEKKKIRIKVKNIAFSAHADTLGILKIVDQCKPENIMLVHGDKNRMRSLSKILIDEFDIPVTMPVNGEIVRVQTDQNISIKIKKEELRKFVKLNESESDINLIMKLSKDENGDMQATDCVNLYKDE